MPPKKMNRPTSVPVLPNDTQKLVISTRLWLPQGSAPLFASPEVLYSPKTFSRWIFSSLSNFPTLPKPTNGHLADFNCAEIQLDLDSAIDPPDWWILTLWCWWYLALGEPQLETSGIVTSLKNFVRSALNHSTISPIVVSSAPLLLDTRPYLTLLSHQTVWVNVFVAYMAFPHSSLAWVSAPITVFVLLVLSSWLKRVSCRQCAEGLLLQLSSTFLHWHTLVGSRVGPRQAPIACWPKPRHYLLPWAWLSHIEASARCSQLISGRRWQNHNVNHWYWYTDVAAI